MSELWERRMTVAFALAVALAFIGGIYGPLAALGIGVFSILGYYLGHHEGDGLH